MLLSRRPSGRTGWTHSGRVLLRLAPRAIAPDPSRAACPTPRTSCLAPPPPCSLHHPRLVPPLVPRTASTGLHWATASRWAHVATVCFIRFRCVLHMFHLDVAKVDLVLHMLQGLYTYVVSVCFKCLAVSNICYKCFIRILHMLQWLYMYVTSVCFTCFRPMLQMFYLDVVYIAYFRHMSQASIQNVSSISDVRCKCVYLDVVVAIHILPLSLNVCRFRFPRNNFD
jgi:hypothetical protein